MVKKIWRKRAPEPTAIGDGIYGLLEKMGGSREKSRLAGLWANWSEALGADMGQAIEPLGARGRVLLIRADNAVQMQELRFMGDEILARVNAWLGTEYFGEARVVLSEAGKNCRKRSQRPAAPPEPAAVRRAPRRPSGKYLAEMDRDSPVAAAYARFAGK